MKDEMIAILSKSISKEEMSEEIKKLIRNPVFTLQAGVEVTVFNETSYRMKMPDSGKIITREMTGCEAMFISQITCLELEIFNLTAQIEDLTKK